MKQLIELSQDEINTITQVLSDKIELYEYENDEYYKTMTNKCKILLDKFCDINK